MKTYTEDQIKKLLLLNPQYISVPHGGAPNDTGYALNNQMQLIGRSSHKEPQRGMIPTNHKGWILAEPNGPIDFRRLNPEEEQKLQKWQSGQKPKKRSHPRMIMIRRD